VTAGHRPRAGAYRRACRVAHPGEIADRAATGRGTVNPDRLRQRVAGVNVTLVASLVMIQVDQQARDRTENMPHRDALEDARRVADRLREIS
jgi:hypothetical protein